MTIAHYDYPRQDGQAEWPVRSKFHYSRPGLQPGSEQKKSKKQVWDQVGDPMKTVADFLTTRCT